ncbi:MAG: sigma-70 family RNA polymerase sigma factor [Lentimicrobium sp.]|nr:sigma-70 family RNA polymerase sigma factor [Lentimicrobium sp.]
MTRTDDSHVIASILDGQTGMYSVLVERYKDMVFSLVLKILKSREEAEEVAQDTFLKAYHALPRFKHEARFSTWLFRIAYNTAISRTRKKQITTLALDENLFENYSTDEVHENINQLDDQQQLELMKKALKTLTHDDQMLISLFYTNQQTVEEISMITGFTESNVKVKLHRIRKKLYKEINSVMQLNHA